MYMRPITKIFVQIEKRFQDEIVTESGFRLWKDTSFKPEENSTIVGIVAGIPAMKLNGYPEGFLFNVQVGDKLYFHYNVVLNLENMVEIDGEQYWMVDYFEAIALVRDGKTIPVGEYILVEPIIEEIKSSVLIIPDAYKEKEENKGTVVASNDESIPVGSVVEYEPQGKFWNVIEGQRVYCMYNNNILVKYDQV
jgi:co-chaperonin GroES (HSP10)